MKHIANIYLLLLFSLLIPSIGCHIEKRVNEACRKPDGLWEKSELYVYFLSILFK